MARNRKRKTDRASTSQEVIAEAIKAVSQKELSYRKAVEKYGIPLSSLKRYCRKASIASGASPVTYGFKQTRKIFSSQEEDNLMQYLKRASYVYFGLSPKEVRKFAYQFAVLSNLNVPESWGKNQQAGEDWFHSFLKRNPSLSIKKPSLSQAESFNKTNVAAFFKLLAQCYDIFSFRPEDIWNMDEIGIMTVQKSDRVVSRREFKQISKTASAVGENLVSLAVAVSAVGNKIPPLFIFPQETFKDHFLNGAPTDSIGFSNPLGWMKEQHFLKFAEHFVQHARAPKERPTLLLLDNHDSHLSISALNYLEENGVVLLSFPPHCGHMLQPLERSMLGPFRKCINRACDSWHRNNPGKTITVCDIPGIVATALPLAMTKKSIKAGFALTGISPLKKDIFLDWEFPPNIVTDYSEVTFCEPQKDYLHWNLPCTSLTSLAQAVTEQATTKELTLNSYIDQMFA